MYITYLGTLSPKNAHHSEVYSKLYATCFYRVFPLDYDQLLAEKWHTTPRNALRRWTSWMEIHKDIPTAL